MGQESISAHLAVNIVTSLGMDRWQVRTRHPVKQTTQASSEINKFCLRLHLYALVKYIVKYIYYYYYYYCYKDSHGFVDR